MEMSEATKLNGIKVKRDRDTIFIPLPRAMWRVAGKCVCDVCKASKATVAYWDTLAVSATPSDNETTWTVHYPELHTATK